MSSKSAVMICGHGSRDEAAVSEFNAMVAAEYPGIDFLKAPYLKDHPLVLDTFADRVREMLDSGNDMDCQLCKYREQIIGYEDEVGTPQQGHHHHVMGIDTGWGRRLKTGGAQQRFHHGVRKSKVTKNPS